MSNSELTTIPAGNLQALGQTAGLVRSGTAYTTAMRVARPRAPRLAEIKEACLAEAELLGKRGFYVWDVNTKDGKTKVVHGPSVGMMLVCARNWGDCAVDVEVQEHGRTFVFIASFVDLETGYNLRRAFRQNKAQNIGDKYDPDRAEDMVFQVGQSKAIRNVIRNALPVWLTEAAENAAADAAYSDVNKVGVEKSAAEGIKAFREDFGVTTEQLVAKIGRPVDDWTARDIVSLQTAMAALHGGEATLDQIFPRQKEDGPAAPKGVEGVMDKLKGQDKPPAEKPAAKPKPAAKATAPKDSRLCPTTDVEGFPVPVTQIRLDAETDQAPTKKSMQALAIAMKDFDEQHMALIREAYGVDSRAHLSAAQVDELRAWVQALAASRPKAPETALDEPASDMF